MASVVISEGEGTEKLNLTRNAINTESKQIVRSINKINYLGVLYLKRN